MFDDNEYEYDYNKILEETDDLYQEEDNEYDYDLSEPSDWEDYYHNLAEDIDD